MITEEYFNKILEEANNIYPKYSNSNSPNKSKNNGKERDLNFLSYLFTNGIKYQYLINNLNVLKKSLCKPKLAKSHIDFIYSRDEILFIPGQWYKFDFMDLLLMKKYYDEKYKDLASNEKIDNDKRIGLLFAIYLKYKNQFNKEIDFVNENSHKINDNVLAKMQSGNYVFFGRPLDLSRFAGIISTEAVRNSNRLEGWVEELGFKKIHFNSAYKRMHLIIYGIEKFINNFEEYKNYLTRNFCVKRSDPSLKDTLDKFIDKPLQKLPKDIKDLLNEFEFRFHRKASFFNLKKFRTLPFIRVMYSNYIWKYKFYVPVVFINYTHLTNILFYEYCFNQNRIEYFDFANGKKTTDEEMRKSFDWLRNTLLNLNLDKALDHKDNKFFKNSKHFKQIRESYPIVKRISENGINLNTEKAKEYLRKQLGNYMSEEASITDEKLSKLFEKIKNYLNKNSMDDSFIEKLFEKENEASEDEINKKDNHHIVKTKWREYDYDLIKYVFLSLVFASFNPEGKIFGHFTTHGANTHRMTSKKFNLQGISKVIRENLFLPSKSDTSRILYSADVSGQDIVVAISLAKKYYSTITKNKNMVGKFNKLISRVIKVNSEGIETESNKKYKGITDYLAYKSYIEARKLIAGNSFYNLNAFDLPGEVDDDKLRIYNFKSVVKEYIYTKLYGGGKSKFLEKSFLELENIKTDLDKTIKINESRRDNFNEIELKLFEALKNLQNILNNIEDYDLNAIIKEIDNYLKFHYEHMSYLIENNLLSDPQANNPDHSFQFFNQIYENHFKKCLLSILFLDTLENKIFQPEFGILKEFLNDVQKFYESEKITLPTLLNWQTVLEDIDTDVRKRITRSRSYPVQASGAELMRQWLIELDKYSKKNDFTIVNTIHDQVILDAPVDKKEDIQKILDRSIKKAAEKLCIEPKLIRLDFKEYNVKNYYN